MYIECMQRLRWLGYISAEEWTKDRIVFYDAIKHFIIKNQELCTLSSDKLQLDLTIRTDNLFCCPLWTTSLVGNYFLEISDIVCYIYNYDLTSAEWDMYVNARNTSGLSFVYSCLASRKQSVGSDGTYQEISL